MPEMVATMLTTIVWGWALCSAILAVVVAALWLVDRESWGAPSLRGAAWAAVAVAAGPLWLLLPVLAALAEREGAR